MSEDAIIGTDGFATLAISCAVMVGTLGASLFVASAYVLYMALRARTAIPPAGRILVLGLRPSYRGLVRPRYRARLARVYAIWKAAPESEIVILGGYTRNAAISEAEAGRHYLIAAGVPAGQIRTEDKSRHTLENLRFYRSGFAKAASKPVPVVTNRFHIARASMMAAGLGIAHVPCAAEARALGLVLDLHLLAWEAFLIHWYITGRSYARLTGNARMMRRIN